MNIKRSALLWFCVLFVIIAILDLVIPPNAGSLQALHIGSAVYHIVTFSLLLPYGLIWFSAFYGYDQLDRYAMTLPNTLEGEAFWQIANGLRVFAWGLMLSTILSLLLTAAEHTAPHLLSTATIINHYVALIIALVALTLIGNGTFALFEFVGARRTKPRTRVLILIITVIGALFVHFLLRNNADQTNPYYLSLYPLLFTIAIPYVYTWAVGFAAVYELRGYAREIGGVLYRRSLGGLANGITIVIVISIVTQYLAAAFGRTPGLPLGVLLLIVYGLLSMEAIGFIMIAIGAKQLKKIEEI